MARILMFDKLLAIVQANETFWAELGAHELRTSQTGIRLGAFLRDVWNPWYAQVLALAAHDLNDRQQAQFCLNVAGQLVQIRDTAGYKYQLPSVYMGDPDAELAEIEEDAQFYRDGMAMNTNAQREMAVRRAPMRGRHR